MAAPSGRARRPRARNSAAVRLKTATPDHGSADGSATIPSRSIRTRSQSSILPIITVITGPIPSTDMPSASRRRSPRSTASPAATAWATLNETVAFTLTPRYVASSITWIPTVVAGNLTMMFGASEAKCTPWASIRSNDRNRVGSVWIDSRPCRPPDASNVGRSSGAARRDISSTIAQARSASVASARSTASARTRPRQCPGSAFQTSATIVGFAVAPTAPKEIAYSSSSTAHEIVPDVRGGRGDRAAKRAVRQRRSRCSDRRFHGASQHADVVRPALTTIVPCGTVRAPQGNRLPVG